MSDSSKMTVEQEMKFIQEKSDKLEKQMQYLLDNEFDFISCGFDRIDENGTRALGRSEVPRDRVECWCKLINSNWVSTQTILCKKGCFDTIRFSPELKRFARNEPAGL